MENQGLSHLKINKAESECKNLFHQTPKGLQSLNRIENMVFGAQLKM